MTCTNEERHLRHTYFRSAVAALLACVVQTAAATVLDFEDLQGYAYFSTPYRGFSFGNNDPATNPWFYSNVVEPDSPPTSGTVSLGTDHRLYARALLEATQPITSPVPFVFVGASFTGFDRIAYDLYQDAVLVHSTCRRRQKPFPGRRSSSPATTPSR